MTAEKFIEMAEYELAEVAEKKHPTNTPASVTPLCFALDANST
jgi:hypothetical protein